MASRQSPEAYRAPRPGEALGRWPANVLHDGSDEVVRAFPAEAGAFAPVRGTEPSAAASGDVVLGARGRVATQFHGDSGSAARFFYSSKADATERVLRCTVCLARFSGARVCRCKGPDGKKPAAVTGHPTVKPVDLMRWLVRLVTPPGGLVLDPFAGTGTTAEAALLEAMRAVLIERDPGYVEDIRFRLARKAGGDAPLFARSGAA